MKTRGVDTPAMAKLVSEMRGAVSAAALPPPADTAGAAKVAERASAAPPPTDVKGSGEAKDGEVAGS
eukprot:6954844-Prorocentrum_lima.AAC.1